MNQSMADDIRERFAFERSRIEPPAGFPKLPDLPLGRYTDEALYQAEIDRLFRRTWLFAGHQCEFPEAGSYRLLDLPFAPVIVARGNDGNLRAFFNACRHRGAPVVRSTEGKTKLFVCQFHSWSYNLDGELVRVPEERDFVGLVREERALPAVRCETWGGFVFVSLDHDAPPLLEWLGSLAGRYGDLVEAPLRLISRSSSELACNWKIAIEAFLEIYHIRTVHAQTGAYILDPPGGVMMLHPSGHSSMFAPFQDYVLSGESPAMELFFPRDVPSIEGAAELYTTSNVSFQVFPNLVTPTDVNGFPILLFWPTAVDRTRFDVIWYGVDWGEGPRPAGWDVKLAAWDVLLDEDRRNLAPIQRSVEAAAHTGVPLNYQERRIWHFHAEVDRWVGRERIPVPLQVPDLLADYVEP
jgi:phenylpropionate dioxygenase-like ring-hydroxylating dioxygenase large terminal subunit